MARHVPTLLSTASLLVALTLLIAPAIADEVGMEDAILAPAAAWTGDLDGMIERRAIRVLVPFSKTFYFMDGPDQRGISYEVFKKYEKELNARLKTRHLKIHVVIVPTARDRLLADLNAGLGDIAAGNLTITPERLSEVDFSDPILKKVSELVLTGPSSPKLASVADLSGKEVHVRRSSSYYQSLVALNTRFAAEGRAPVLIVPTNDNLEDEDLIEMVANDLLPAIVVDSHKARFWSQIFDTIQVHEDVAVATGRQIGWAVRKGSPQLRADLNRFAKGVKKGTLFGNILFKRYLRNTEWVQNALDENERQRFEQTVDLFREYSENYGFDWLMVAALSYQESGLDQSVRSHVGAIGLMQLMPSTAADPNVDIADIEVAENNVHAGVKYLRFLRDRYFDDAAIDPLNQMLFSFAAYNAGPAKVRRLRAEATKTGLDRNLWFRNVEVVAARRIGRETVQYVSNIFKYYLAYKRLVEQEKSRDAALHALDATSSD